MSRGPHPAAAALAAMARGRDARPSVREARHVEGCARCRSTLADLQILAGALGEESRGPSPGVEARAWALMEPRAPRTRDTSRFRLARLIYDSGAVAAVHGVRAPLAARRQTWRTPGADFDVRFEPSGLGAPAMLIGQIFPRDRKTPDPLGGSVWLLERGRSARWTQLGAGGEFELPAPRARRSSLWVEWGPLRFRMVLP